MTGILSVDAIICLIAGFVLTAVITKIMLPILRKKKLGQTIYQEGPSWHSGKQGTPTMGGLAFILAVLILFTAVFLIKAFKHCASLYIGLAMTLALGVANGIIGFIDDYAKLLKKQNLGLKAYQKLILQLVAAAAYITVMAYTGLIDTTVLIPFTSGKTIDLWYFAYPIYVIVITGFVNSTNLTDGLDGLAGGITFTVSAFLVIIAMIYRIEDVALTGAAMAGSMLGFLLYNHNPAKIFMGDTGSLFIGGILMGVAFMSRHLLVVLLVGLVYICEMLSSLLQVVYYKLTHGKRIFKMAPVHHHFERCGWSEIKIDFVFSTVTAILCVIGGFAW